MTQLFIDGQELVLPDSFQCKSVRENPLFTKAGDYTLNISLSLDNPVNAKIYKHINRINSLSRFENRTAILMSDNEVIIKGEEVILKYSNKTVEIQIVAGNSSLNYLIGNNLNLRELNLGSAYIDKSKIVFNLAKDYPEVDYQLLPFYDRELDFIGNRYSFTYDSLLGRNRLIYAYDGEFKSTLVSGSTERYKYENYRPQPYLCAIIKKIFQSMGYTLENVLESHPIYKYAYIVHANDTTEFAKMLPSWTVSKFFEEIENLFDCTVIVDNNTMSAKIVFNYQFYSASSENTITMLDDFEAEIEDAGERMQYEKNISYNLPDSLYYKYQSLTKELINSLAVITGGYGTDKENIEGIANSIKSKSPDTVRAGQRYLHKSAALQFIEYVDPVEAQGVYAKSVNDYYPLKKNESDSEDTSFDIIPAEFHTYNFRGYTNYTPWFMILQLPVVKCSETPLVLTEIDGVVTNPLVQDVIEGEEAVSGESSNSGPMSIAFYNSMYSVAFNDAETIPANDQTHPLSFVRSISERVDTFSTHRYHFYNSYNGKFVNALSLQFLHEEIYSKNGKIDRSKIYKIQFLTGRNLDPKQIYVIGNRKFYCRKIERNITIDGFDEVVEGEFYAEGD